MMITDKLHYHTYIIQRYWINNICLCTFMLVIIKIQIFRRKRKKRYLNYKNISFLCGTLNAVLLFEDNFIV